MANFAAIVIGSSETERTFSPAGYKAGAATFEQRSSGVPIGYDRLSIRKTANQAVRRDRIVLEKPKLQVSTTAAADGFVPAPRVSHTDRVSIEFVCSNLSNVADRQALLSEIIAICQHELVTGVVVNQDEI